MWDQSVGEGCDEWLAGPNRSTMIEGCASFRSDRDGHCALINVVCCGTPPQTPENVTCEVRAEQVQEIQLKREGCVDGTPASAWCLCLTTEWWLIQRKTIV